MNSFIVVLAYYIVFCLLSLNYISSKYYIGYKKSNKININLRDINLSIHKSRPRSLLILTIIGLLYRPPRVHQPDIRGDGSIESNFHLAFKGICRAVEYNTLVGLTSVCSEEVNGEDYRHNRVHSYSRGHPSSTSTTSFMH